MVYLRQPGAQVRHRLLSVIHQNQFGVQIRLPLKAAERLGNELVTVFGCHDTGDESCRLTVRTASRIWWDDSVGHEQTSLRKGSNFTITNEKVQAGGMRRYLLPRMPPNYFRF